MPHRFKIIALAVAIALSTAGSRAAEQRIISKPGLFKSLTEPPCSYCSTQHRKKLIREEDPAICWLRGAHNGGAIPIRHFLAAPRIINDTYGLFFFDPDGGYVSAFEKDYGYEFYGWRGGVMVAKGKDGTLWSCLSGKAFEGPQKGKRLKRISSMPTEWGYWLLLHPESTAYDLFDGAKYPKAELPTKATPEAKESMGKVDERLPAEALVLAVDAFERSKAYQLPVQEERACFTDAIDGQPLVVFWYSPTRSSVAWSPVVDGRTLTFYASKSSPETAPFKDNETGTRWTLAGRAVDGPLRGKELTWISSIQCKWYAWSAEYPDSHVYTPGK